MKLTTRERRMIIGLGTVLAAGIILVFAVKPAVDRTKTLRRVIPDKYRTLAELSKKSSELVAMRIGIESLLIDGDDSVDTAGLIAALESMTRRLKLDGKVESMNQSIVPLENSDYSEIVVHAMFTDVTLDQLVGFLVETTRTYRFLRTTSLSIRTSSNNPNLLDSEIYISALRADAKT